MEDCTEEVRRLQLEDCGPPQLKTTTTTTRPPSENTTLNYKAILDWMFNKTTTTTTTTTTKPEFDINKVLIIIFQFSTIIVCLKYLQEAGMVPKVIDYGEWGVLVAQNESSANILLCNCSDSLPEPVKLKLRIRNVYWNRLLADSR